MVTVLPLAPWLSALSNLSSFLCFPVLVPFLPLFNPNPKVVLCEDAIEILEAMVLRFFGVNV
jgi:hypothetical protein